MKHIYFKVLILCTLTAIFTFKVSALDVTLDTPGTLAEKLGNDAAATSLTIKGDIDVRDFDFIRDELNGVITTIDLSGASIVAYEGAPTFTGRTQSSANTLPEGALMIASLANVTLPAQLVEIGDGALATTAISTIVLPETLKKIGRSAFAGCSNLTDIILPASLAYIGAGAFADCTKLISADLTKASALTTLANATFARCDALQSVALPATLALIGDDAFNGCNALAAFNFPPALTRIGARAFYGTNLNEANLKDCKSLTEIDEWAFANCAQLESTTLPAGLTTLGKGAFYNASALTLSELPNVAKIDDLSLAGIQGVTEPELTLTDGIEIGDFAMSGWKTVQLLTLPANVKRIGTEAMAGWTALTEIDATEALTVPLLGADVWAGVDQPSVMLRTSEELAEEFKTTDQWKEFNIEAETSGVDSLPADNADSQGIRAWFEGMTLHVLAPTDIANIEIFDANGRRFSFPTSLVEPTHAGIDTSAWNVRVMLVRILLANGTSAALKLAR